MQFEELVDNKLATCYDRLMETDFDKGYQRGQKLARDYFDQIIPGYVLRAVTDDQSHEWMAGFYTALQHVEDEAANDERFPGLA